MSAIALIVNPDDPEGGADAGAMSAMLAATGARGGPERETTRLGFAIAGAAQASWQRELAGPSLARNDDCLVVADATLYYIPDLQRALGSAASRGAEISGASLILRAFEKWGDACVDHLEGDYAFVVWRASTSTLFAARDFSAGRTLYYACVGRGLAVATTIAAVRAHPLVQSELDVGYVGFIAAGLGADDVRTGWKGIEAVGAPASVRWRPGESPVRVSRTPYTPLASARDLSSNEAPEALRALIDAATTERMRGVPRVTVTLSGGFDSSSVYASARAVAVREGAPGKVGAVSVFYPSGDPGHEDDLIALVLEGSGGATTPIRIEDIPFLDASEKVALQRDQPFNHVFEGFNRALGRAALTDGSRVMLTGRGGDELFNVSDAYLSDLVWSGRWLAAWRDCRNTRFTDYRSLVRAAVLPRLGSRSRRLISAIRGKPLRGYFDRSVPAWIRPEFARQQGLLEREQQGVPVRRWGESFADYEMRFMLTNPVFLRTFGLTYDFAFSEGVESRWPLLDRRIVGFMAARPREDRSLHGRGKTLLRRSMRGRVPDAFLAPRRTRTGLTTGYFERGFFEEWWSWISEILSKTLLGDLGIVDSDALRSALLHARNTRDPDEAYELCVALHTELWLRANLATGAAGRSRV